LTDVGISNAPTFVAVLETEVFEAITKLATKLNRAHTIVCGLVVECPISQDYTFGI
jgi:hypothetical protein